MTQPFSFPKSVAEYWRRLAYLNPMHEAKFNHECEQLIPCTKSRIPPIELGRDEVNSYYLIAGPYAPEDDWSEYLDPNEVDQMITRFQCHDSGSGALQYGIILGKLMLGNSKVSVRDSNSDSGATHHLEPTDFFVVMDILDKGLWLVLDFDVEDEFEEPWYLKLENDDEWPDLLPVLSRRERKKRVGVVKIANGDWVGDPPKRPSFEFGENVYPGVEISAASRREVNGRLAPLKDLYPSPPQNSENTPDKQGTKRVDASVTPPKEGIEQPTAPSTSSLSTRSRSTTDKLYVSLEKGGDAGSKHSTSDETKAMSRSPSSSRPAPSKP